MSIPNVTALSTLIARCDPQDAQANIGILEAMKVLRPEVQELGCEAALEGLDGAMLMLKFHVHTAGLGGPELIDILQSVVSYVDQCLGQEAPAPSSNVASAPIAMDPVAVVGDMQLGQILVRMGFVQEPEINLCVAFARDQHMNLGQALVVNKFVGEDQIREALGYQETCRQAALARAAAEIKPAHRVRGEGPRVIRMSNASDPEKGLGLKLMTDVMLGELLMRNGAITQDQLDVALLCQRVTGVRLGEALVGDQACTWEQIEVALDQQSRLRNQA